MVDPGNLKLLLDLLEIDMGNGFVAVEDLCNLLQRGALGLDKDEVDPDPLDDIPELEHSGVDREKISLPF